MRRVNLKSLWWLPVAAITLAACGGTDSVDDVLEEMDPPQTQYIEEEEGLEGEEGLDWEEGFEVQGDVEDERDDGEIGDTVTDMDGDGFADQEVEEKGGSVVSESVMTELYLFDRNGLVAPQTMNVPRGESNLEVTIEHLVQGGPVTEMLPNGFQAVLPAGTEVLGYEVSNGVATIDFSEHFAEYHPERELQVLQALTWTLTQIDDIDRVMLQMNGEDLAEMPQNGTPVSSGYTRSHGINLETNDVHDIVNTKPVIVYFLSQTEDYYVPVTRRVPNDMDNYTAAVSELVKGPDMMSGLLSSLRGEVELLDDPQLGSSGTLTLNFNEALRSQLEGTAVSEEALNMLVLSLTEQPDVQDVAIQVESEGTLLVSTGETITEPVSRPSNVNTGEY